MRINILTVFMNTLPYAKLWFESLEKNSYYKDHNLLLADIMSIDGTKEFLKSKTDNVLDIDEYQIFNKIINKSIDKIDSDYILVCDSDIIFTKNWDKILLDIMEKRNLNCLSPMTIENMESQNMIYAFRRRWDPIYTKPANTIEELNLVLEKMYGSSIEQYMNLSFLTKDNRIFPGISGSFHLVTRKTLDALGGKFIEWGCPDWSIYIQLALLNDVFNRKDIIPPRTTSDCYIHHFMRATYNKHQHIFDNFIPEDHTPAVDLWGKEIVNKYWKKI